MIKLMKKTFYNEDKTKKLLCNFILKSKKLSMGPKCLEFEEKFSKYQGCKYSVLVNSGSSANLLLIQALLNLGLLKKGNKVGISALTWATNVMPLLELGLKPVLIDTSKGNLNINSENILNIKENIDALFLTHLIGFAGDIKKIKKLCKDKGILLIEDTCESLGSEVNGIKLGNFGLASSFSFFVGHHLSTIEGGMVGTNNKELYEMLLMVRAHGWNRNLNENKRSKLRKEYNISKDFYDSFRFYTLGYNLRPTEITGFIGCEQMKYINTICSKRNKNFKRYQDVIKNNKEIKDLDVNHMSFVSNFAYPLIFNDNQTMERYIKRFSDVEIRPICSNMCNQPFFKNKSHCPNAERVFNFGFYIPNNPDLTKDELNYVCGLLK